MPLKIGIVDTTFARVDMAEFALNEFKKGTPSAEIERVTVPGIKDIPGGAKRILEKGCDGVLTLGWVGEEMVDKFSYLSTSAALIWLELTSEAIIIDVTVHENETNTEKELYEIAEDRSRKHAQNLILLLKNPDKLQKWAGTGKRQGYPDAGSIKE